MTTRVIHLSYNPKLLGEALMKQYKSSEEEIYKEFEKLGFKSEEEKAWFQSFSFAFSLRNEEGGSEKLKFVPPLPETLNASIGKMKSLEGLAFASFEGLPDQIFDTIKAFSVLGMAAAALDMAALRFTKKEDYDEFVDSVFAAREALAGYRLRIRGIQHKKLVARANALKRHHETYMLRNEVVEYWKANISPSLSNEKAADALLKTFPLSHRKLKQYVAAAKRFWYR
ncbi:hypothetical protein SAMN05216404_11917 [Nitrosospira multiformis]|uniref:Uncharacterized protein n=1 Tax=Nitrosospira multiformis TaxID=1231 RepID=A0A1H8P5Z4_9PROT|nr:hypothetical protein [Nitrosospira multiformis]SEO36943.1 hypothetical protein SAMN05216404_11917 [Nitrosospira multiformis]